MFNNLPVLIVVMLLISAFLAPLFVRRFRRATQVVAGVVTWTAAGLSAWLLARVVQAGPIRFAVGGWPAPWGIEVTATPLSAFVVTVATVIVAIVMLGLPREQRDWPSNRAGWYITLLLLLTAAMAGMTFANDLFNLYVFFEVTALSSWGIVAAKTDRSAADASFKYLMLGAIGSSFVLFAIGITYVVTGYLNMSFASAFIAAAQLHPIIPWVIATFFLVGLALKAGLFPMHIWLPDAHSAAPTSASALLSGVVVKVYAVAMAKVFYGLFGGASLEAMGISEMVRLAAVLSILAGSLFALVQTDIKRLLAYSTVAQIGYVFLGFGLGGTVGVAAALYHILAHGLMKASLFLASGKVIELRGSRNIKGFAGAGRLLPLPMAIFTLAALSMVGLPLLAGFTTKWYLFNAGLEARLYWVPVVVILSSLLNAAYFLPIVWRIWFGQGEAEGAADRRVPGLIPLAVLLVAVGLVPNPLLNLLQQAAAWLIS
ncbi:MAG: monovalent cation/H+ antiporter subunit D family protein [Firmicutes bacterium]|nr:monovalent cation/H+ antiporter subunit D family protein [Bacillota bacterium]HOB34995.1 proton-conducting transporter membrane subunit [Bacillota bacterium]HPZ90970.1 proton-conducting transporter membrane subunit [Bacillota bacterium]HQE02170.1 proton-conducting transporter membrane subunit [Bacillota bacterium]